MLVFPSLWEGFGLPVVEAMACGTPVLTSNLSSLPEIAGQAAVLVDPYSVDDIVAGMQRLSEDSALRSQLRELGLERSRLFSWQRNAEQTLAAYHDVA
jgi:glycosyltransferase involved in cell wall biosynthesis